MLRDNSDAAWEKFGQKDAYFGVYSTDRFKDDNLTPEVLAEFFASGERHVDGVFERLIEIYGSIDPHSMRVLDYGCGVGRLVLPFARRCSEVVGVDISTSMLEKAAAHAAEQGLTNVSLTQPGSDTLSSINGTFDLVHSHIVFQHIPPQRGHVIIESLADKINPGGFLVIDSNLASKETKLRRFANFMRRNFKPTQYLINALRGNRLDQPFMQMNTYNAERLLLGLIDRGFAEINIRPYDQGGRKQHRGILVFARKTVS